MAEGWLNRLAYPAEYLPEISRFALLVDGTIDLDPAATVVWSNQELALIQQAEVTAGHSLHKGHALHNIGVAVYAADPPGARVRQAPLLVDGLSPRGTRSRTSNSGRRRL